MFQCKPCNKTFTGQCNYDQHVVSSKHKKKMQEISLLDGCAPINGISTMKPRLASFFQCSICKSEFDTMENFKKHVESPQHALKVIEQAKEKVSDNIISTSDNSTESHASIITPEIMNVDQDESLVPGFGTQKLFYAKCETCDKTFSGPEPYKEHIQSNDHQRRMSTHLSETNTNMALLSCKICNKNFSGPVPYKQHMDSDTHKKKENQILLMQSLSLQKSETEISGGVNSNQWFCKICNTQCSGFFPYKQHLEGSTHFKNSKRIQEQYCIKNNTMEVTMDLDKQKNECDNGALENSQISEGGHLETSIQIIEEDYVIPNTGRRLEVMSTNKLQELVTVVLPDENIDFDKSAAKITNAGRENSDLNYEKDEELVPRGEADTEKVEEEVENIEEIEEEAVFQVCELCDVKLYNKDELICHYESEAHFEKKMVFKLNGQRE